MRSVADQVPVYFRLIGLAWRFYGSLEVLSRRQRKFFERLKLNSTLREEHTLGDKQQTT